MPKIRQRVEIAIPIYNEERELEHNILKLYNFCQKNLKNYVWHIVIADNASEDKSPSIGQALAKKYQEVDYFYLADKGRGRAVKRVWLDYPADIYAYMDVDLSTDLSHFPALLEALNSGYDIAIGSRLLPESRVTNRTLKREILSRVYNALIKILFQTHFSDAQCGFKAITGQAARRLIPRIDDNDWFFDSELLIIGEKSGYKIYEEPILWIDNAGSTVRVLKTVTGDLQGLWRLWWTKPWQ